MKVPFYAQDFPWKEIFKAEQIYEIHWPFLAALIQTESSGNPWAMRYEPKFDYLHDTNLLQNLWHVPASTVEYMQKCSYGYCQVMGATAIDLGLLKLKNEKFLWPTLLFRTDINLMFASKLINKKVKAYGNDPLLLYAAYNAGTPHKTEKGSFTNQWAVDKFKRYFDDFNDVSDIAKIEI